MPSVDSLDLSSKIHPPLQHPYYILAPDYRDTSSGISALHHLCHTLNLLGESAYIVGATVLNPELKTSVLTEDIHARTLLNHQVPIVIYPEVAQGNPLNALAVVRYFLNREGALMQVGVNGSSSDLRFYFHPWTLADDPHTDGLLTFPTLDVTIFYPPRSSRQKRQGKYLYLNRYPHGRVDFKKLPKDIQILSTANPLSLSDLAELFRHIEVLYSYEWSATNTGAMMCGCPVIFIPGAGAEASFLTTVFDGKNGWAMLDEPNGLERAQATLPFWADLDEYHRSFYSQQLPYFLALTQHYAHGFKGQACIDYPGYTKWLDARCPSLARQQRLEAFLHNSVAPKIAIIVIDQTGHSVALQATLDSLRGQIYPATQVQIFSIAHPPNDKQSSEVFTTTATPWKTFFEQGLQAITYPWIQILCAGDRLESHALLLLTERLVARPSMLACYTDEDTCLEQDAFSTEKSTQPFFKPDFNLDLLCSYPYIGRCLLINRQAALELKKSALALGETLPTEFVFQLTHQHGAACIEHLPEVLHHSHIGLLEWSERKDIQAEFKQVLSAHLDRVLEHSHTSHHITPGALSGTHRITYQHAKKPQISIILSISAEWEPNWVKTQIETLTQKTLYPHYEWIVIEQTHTALAPSTKLSTLLADFQLKSLNHFQWPHAFNLSAIHNFAAQQALGDYLLFLNPQLTVFRQGWLEELVQHAQRPEVGAVGAKLTVSNPACPQDRLVQSPIFLGIGDSVHPLVFSESEPVPGYMNRLQVVQNVSSLNGHCFMVRTSLFHKLGGFDEGTFNTHFSDVDLCLKIKQTGYLLVWTPYTQMDYIGSEGTVGVRKQQAAFITCPQPEPFTLNALYEKWLPQLAHDPAYHPYFSLERPGFSIDEHRTAVVTPTLSRPVPVIFARHRDFGPHGYYRVIHPFQALENAGKIEGGLMAKLPKLVEQARLRPDIMVLHHATGAQALDYLKKYKTHSRAFLIGECDDFLLRLQIEKQHPKSIPKTLAQTFREELAYFDRLVVATDALAEVLKHFYSSEIRVAPNRLLPQWWKPLRGLKRQSQKPRIGWAGGLSHSNDLIILEPLIKTLIDKVEWVFFGLRPGVKQDIEFHAPVSMEDYPAKLAGLNLDLALVPSQINALNNCKSNLRLLELGACGFPVICTNTGQLDQLPVTAVRNQYKDWLNAIQMHLADLSASAKMGDDLRSAVHRDWMLEGANLASWQSAWQIR